MPVLYHRLQYCYSLYISVIYNQYMSVLVIITLLNSFHYYTIDKVVRMVLIVISLLFQGDSIASIIPFCFIAYFGNKLCRIIQLHLSPIGVISALFSVLAKDS